MQDLRATLPEHITSILALDLETNGLDPLAPGFAIIGIGFADELGVSYFDWASMSVMTLDYLFEQLRRRPLTAFNVGFEALVLWAAGLGWLNWSMCSYGLYRQMASEDFDKQRWDLESLQRDVLGWTYSNKESLRHLMEKHAVTKDDMWKLAELEPEPFGLYCAEDAEAALQGFEELRDATFRFGETGARLRSYHKDEWLVEVEMLCEQYIEGITIDVPSLRQFRGMTALEEAERNLAFLSHPDVKPHVDLHNQTVRDAYAGKEPAALTSKGVTSALWIRWSEKMKYMGTRNFFNPASRQQLAWLFYDRLDYTPKKFTDGGDPSTDKEMLPFLGPAGKYLLATKKLVKLLQYVDSCLARQRDGTLHAPCKTIGTTTGRLAGGQLDV